MNDLEKHFKENDKRYFTKWSHYLDVYDRHFQKYRGKNVNILEIGVSHGGSLQMWKNYFGDKAKIFGVDINPVCRDFEEKNITIFIGSQSDRNFLREIKKKMPPIDILIDDGGHTMNQQIVTFEELFNIVKDGGVYVCEDLHTSYWLYYGGGYKRRGTFIEYSKVFIDYLNAYHSEQKALKPNTFTRSVNAIHYYDSMIVIEKINRAKPYRVESGNISFNKETMEYSRLIRFRKKWTHQVLVSINQALRFFRLRSIYWK